MSGIEDLREAVVERARDAWVWVVVAALGVFMFATRMRPHDEYYQGPDQAFLFGTDAYYHTRQIYYTVNNWPELLAFDPWTQFPKGTGMGTFGTLFDQGAATLTWAWSLVTLQGAPSRATVIEVATAYPAVIGALTIVPIFLLARDLFGRKPALFVAVATALIPGSFTVRSLAGFPDHHIMEVLWSTFAVWGTWRALKDWEATELGLADMLEDPAVVWTRARWALGTSLLAALAYWALMATWPPGILFVAIAGTWLALEAAIRGTRGDDPGPVVAAALTTFAFTAVLVVPHALASHRAPFVPVDASWLQPTVALAVGLGVLAVALTARAWHDRELPAAGYVPTAIVAGVAGLAALNLVAPGIVDTMLTGASWVLDSTMGWVPGLDVNRGRLTIGEAQPTTLGTYYADYGFLLYTALFAWAVAAIDLFRRREPSDGLLVVWMFFGLSAALTQTRFGYLFAVPVVLLNGNLARRLFDAADMMSQADEDDRSQDRIDPATGHAVVIALLALALFPVNVAGFTAGCGGDVNAWSQADCFGPDSETRDWHRASSWLETHSPDAGVDLAASYDVPKHRPDYPEEAYGVLSWWDYGHQIQWDGTRAPIANPFQQNAPLASEIFTAASEDEALSILDDYLEGERTRYLMIDDAMATGKFSAITVWAGVDGTYNSPEARTFTVGQGDNQTTANLPAVPREAFDWFLQDVYHGDGDELEHMRLVHETGRYSLIGTVARQGGDGQVRIQRGGYNDVFQSGSAERMSQLPPRITGGEVGPTLTFDSGDRAYPQNERVLYDLSIESSLKTYERVPGATLTGQAPPGQDVTVTVPLEVEPTGRTFVYGQNASVGDDGRFEVTVPYPTTDRMGTDAGATEADVTARATYRVTVGEQTTRVDVPEQAVLDGEQVPVQPT